MNNFLWFMYLHKLHKVCLLYVSYHEKNILKSSAIGECYEETMPLVPPTTTLEDSEVVPIHMEEGNPPIMDFTTLIEDVNTQPMVANVFIALGSLVPMSTPILILAISICLLIPCSTITYPYPTYKNWDIV
jgi:hypothetical protein